MGPKGKCGQQKGRCFQGSGQDLKLVGRGLEARGFGNVTTMQRHVHSALIVDASGSGPVDIICITDATTAGAQRVGDSASLILVVPQVKNHSCLQDENRSTC